MLHFVNFVGSHQADLQVPRYAAFHHPHQHHCAAINIEPGIEDQRLHGIFRAAFWGRNALDHRFQNIFHADAAFCADHQRVVGRNRQHIFNLLFHVIRLRGGQIYFVDHRNNGEIVPSGEKSVSDRLRFHALTGIHHQQRTFAGGKRAGNFIGKIYVAGRVDQIQAIGVAVFRLVVQADAFCLDRDAALALQVHGVEDLFVHFALGKRPGHFEQAVRQRGFAVINVRDDTKIAYELWVHSYPLPPGIFLKVILSVRRRARKRAV